MLPRLRNYILPAILLILLAVGALYYSFARIKPASVISREDLEQQYGLRVNLVAVTASGGMVDLRLKIVDAAKAKALLQETANFPALYVGARKVTLQAPQDTRSQELSIEDDGNIFLLYPNAGNAVQHGTPINIMFGDLRLEPIVTQ